MSRASQVRRRICRRSWVDKAQPGRVGRPSVKTTSKSSSVCSDEFQLLSQVKKEVLRQSEMHCYGTFDSGRSGLTVSGWLLKQYSASEYNFMNMSSFFKSPSLPSVGYKALFLESYDLANHLQLPHTVLAFHVVKECPLSSGNDVAGCAGWGVQSGLVLWLL